MRNVLQWVCLMQVVCSVVIVMLLSNQLIMVCCGFEWSFDVHVVAFPAFELIEFLSEVVAAIFMGFICFRYEAIIEMIKGL
ncbi:MAG: hypothetical protein IKJ89_06900 [Kiritimatiellae bacterium]|nr:hypothetical protein [Kiritimatiellia bacterium]